MRATFLLTICLLFSVVVWAKKDNAIYIKSLDMKLVSVPCGIYMSQEITNLQYLNFLYDLVQKGNEGEYRRMLPDSLVWRTTLSYGEPMLEYYFRHPAYNSFPMVGITLEQANAYCKWITEVVKKDAKLNLPEAICALPTEKEWVIASAPFMDNPYPWYGPYAYNEGGEMLCNVKVKRVDWEYNSYYGMGSTALTAQAISFYPNKYGLHNMIGNVAEITSEGYIKGGGWDNTFDECAVNKRLDIELPSANVGFRVVLHPKGVVVKPTGGKW